MTPVLTCANYSELSTMMHKRKIRMKGAVVLVTGAGQGIGLAVTQEALSQGAIVVAVEVDPGHEQMLAALIGAGGTVQIADVCNAGRMNEIVDRAIATHGGIDIVIANAGIERVSPVVDMPPETFNAVLNVNINGVYNTIKPCLPSIIERGGHVLAISSIAGLIPFPMAAAYATSKAAVDMMMRVLRMELIGTGATAGAAYFGFVQTQMADRIFANPSTATAVNRLPTWLLGIKPQPTAERVAKRILAAACRRRARVFAPRMVSITYMLRGPYALLDWPLGKYLMRIDKLIHDFQAQQKKNEH